MNRKEKIKFLKDVVSGKSISSLIEPNPTAAKVYLVTTDSNIVTILLPEGGTEIITTKDFEQVKENSKDRWVCFE